MATRKRINQTNKKNGDMWEKPFTFIVISWIFAFLTLIVKLSIIYNEEYEWCIQHNWPEGTGNCFAKGIEFLGGYGLIILFMTAQVVCLIIAGKKYKKATNKKTIIYYLIATALLLFAVCAYSFLA